MQKGDPSKDSEPRVVKTWKPQRFAIVCLDPNTGEPQWMRIVNEGMPHQGHHWKAGFASASPVTDGRLLYSYFGTFGLFCHDLEGRLVWKADLGALAIEDSLGSGQRP